LTTTDDLYPEVEKAARAATRSWTGALDAGDIVQDMWVKIYEARNTLPTLLSYEHGQRGKVLRAIARQCAGAEMADRELFSSNVTYSTDDVRRILDKGGAGDVPGTPSHVEWIDVHAGSELLTRGTRRSSSPTTSSVTTSRPVTGARS
jgi:hypothetical protein